MKENIELEKMYLAFTDWLNRILEDQYNTDKVYNYFFQKMVEKLSNGKDFEMKAKFTKSGSNCLWLYDGKLAYQQDWN